MQESARSGTADHVFPARQKEDTMHEQMLAEAVSKVEARQAEELRQQRRELAQARHEKQGKLERLAGELAAERARTAKLESELLDMQRQGERS